MVSYNSNFEFPDGKINLFNPSLAQIKTFEEIQKEVNAQYEPLQPLGNIRAPLFASKLHTAADVQQAFDEIKGSSAADIEKKARQVYARIDKDMRSNPEEMLKLLKHHPRAITLIDPALATQNFFLQALEQNHRVYDLLPREAQENQELVDKYREGVFKNPETVPLTTREYDYRNADIPVINPNCPIEKFATPEAYKELMKDVFSMQNMPSTSHNLSHDSFHHLGKTTGAVLMLRQLAPHLDKEFARAELEAFKEKKDVFLKTATPIKAAESNHVMKTFTHKHDLQDFRAEYNIAAWHNRCKDLTENRTPSPAHITEIAKYCPKEIAEQYFDMEKGEPLPHTPSMQRLAEEAIKLQQRIDRNPNEYHDQAILAILATGPVSVVKEHLDLETYMRQAALRVERSEANELLAPSPAAPRGMERDTYERALEQQRTRANNFVNGLTKYPEYLQMVKEEIAALRAERKSFTKEERDLRFTQQWAYEYPRGSKQLDHTIIRCMQEHSPEQCQKHLDVQGYLERRADWLYQTACYADLQKEATAFKNLLAQTPEAKQIVLNKLTELGARDPQKMLETPTTKFAFSQEKHTAPAERDTPDKNRVYNMNATYQNPNFDDGPDLSK